MIVTRFILKTGLLSNYQGKLISSLVFCVCALGQGIQPSWAEGSKQLIVNGGDRPYLEWRNSNTKTAGIIRQNELKVYVQSGETVYLGSSVYNAAPTANNQDIIYRSPNGIQNACDVVNGGFGHINTLTKENLGPAPLATGGYTPCSFVAAETGIYEIEFRSPDPNSDPPPILANSQFPIDSSQKGGVAAWDITVAKNGVAQTGRLFTNYIALNMGSNGRLLNSSLYIQTKDGYVYKTDLNGIDPYGFIAFANSRGYIDKTNNSTLYRSAVANDNNLLFNGNISVQDPSIPDTATDITHFVFINPPDSLAIAALNIPLIPILPPIPNNFLFTGGTGGSGNQTFEGVGGNFSFDVNSSGSYQIIIDTNLITDANGNNITDANGNNIHGDGIFDPSVDRVLQNVMSAGQTVVPWDGKDASETVLPPKLGNQPYKAQITTRSGEYHFPLLDPENNPSGLKITMQNPPPTFPAILDQNGQLIGPSTFYYNDNNYITANNTSISLDGTGASSPRNASMGINSSGGGHRFTNNYGDFKGIDTWTYFPSQPVETDLVITSINQANVKGTKSVRFAVDNDGSQTVNVGDIVEYTITYSNLSPGNSDAINFVITDNLPSQLTFQNAIISSATSGNNITLNNTYNGSGVLTNSGTLRVGDTITITITATINNNSGNPISNQASATFNTPDNPSAAVGTVLTDADSAGATNNPPTVGNSFAQIANDGINRGNDPSKTDDDDPTLFTVTTNLNPPNIVLVKRITRINNQDFNNFVDGSSLVSPTADNYVASPHDLNDNDPKWPSGYLKGLINAGTVKPGDELEYTIYFLSNGLAPATKVQFCDLVPSNVTFIPTAFNGLTPNDGGLPTADQGIALAISNATPTAYLSNVADTDRGTFYPPSNANIPKSCSINTNGAVVVDITNSTTLLNLPAATYGFVRFRGQVK